MFGDHPAATIATTAVQQTALTYEHIDRKVAVKIVSDSYVDDILTGEEDFEAVESLKSGIEKILEKGGFKVKGVVTSGDTSKEMLLLLCSGDFGRVLGIGWEPWKDVFMIKARSNLSRKYMSAKIGRDLSYEEIPAVVNRRIT